MDKAQSLRQKHEARLGASAPDWLKNTVLGQFKFVMDICGEDNKYMDHIILSLKKEEVVEYLITVSTLYAKLARRKDHLQKE